MLSIKSGTQSWSPAAQKSSLKGDDNNYISATDKENFIGDQPVGDYLNKIADPNYIPPEKVHRQQKNELDKEAFMKLMLTQMKNQDPMNPMQSHEMAAQLAQFSSVEQLQNINQTLTGMKSSQDPANSFQALNFIGKAVSGDTSLITRAQGDKSHDFGFELMADAQQVKLTIQDESGETIRSMEIRDLKKGKNNISWNGIKEDGMEARPGLYRCQIEAKDNSGHKIGAMTAFSGKITGVNFAPTGPMLMIGQQTVRLADVKKIEDPGLAQETKAAVPTIAGGAPGAVVVPGKAGGPANAPQAPVRKPDAKAPKVEPTNNLENVAMSSTMINNLNKQLEKSNK